MNMMVFDGEAIRRARKAQGLTLEALAAIIGSSKIAISRWENGKAHPRPEVARRLQQWLSQNAPDNANAPDHRFATRTLSISVPQRLFETAAEEGLNITQLFETVGTQAVRKAVEDEWRRQNAEAIRHNNEELEKNGLWSDGLRLF